MKFVNIEYRYTDSGDCEYIYVNDVCVAGGSCNQMPEAVEAIESTLNLLGIAFKTKSIKVDDEEEEDEE